MLFAEKTPAEKRKDFRAALASGRLLRFPGAWSPLVAMQIQRFGFEGVYISGAVLSNDLGYPDIGLTTLSEVAARGRAIARVTTLPSIIDMDTGFGEALNAARTVQELEEMGLCGAHLEDQVNPKRCGHLEGKSLVEADTMVRKIVAAAKARHDSNFVIIARTDARASEGLEKAIERAKAYVDAGADMIFPEAMEGLADFEAMRKAVKVPLLANMTEFGKSKLLSTKELTSLGYNMVIYPVTTLRLAMKAVEDGLRTIMNDGSQEALMPRMQTRKELYELLRYDEYTELDTSVAGFRGKAVS
ncbi:MAG: methylisocitrate lyase [Clostridia bacterium]|nr:methylisocitrate lyase [Deltaproteobacteria bacterium]